ncbi:O-antigen ligase domain-containing protein [Candidimonas sp. SYP-B2681]|uniref:O-antigen ligase family protein n=1 Tax=Candidimonas sp. SYP-B2681 TaxID=2497686 RepID=UPI000F892D0C|nr:O-antigen ligase family protein [Candidimonas sp. SYP-B2681]RTZ42384.1 O-antigen ligase domain-containing protein [Candidimonas sp. SYP-B2681]
MIAALGLLLFTIFSNKTSLQAFAYGIALNIFPLAVMQEMSMDIARIAGMPLAYLPITSAGIAMALRNHTRLPRSYSLLLTLTIIYCVYSFFTTVILGGVTSANIAYWLAWPLNFVIFFSAAAFFSRVDISAANKAIKAVVTVLVMGCLVGVARYVAGIGEDANFMPVMNRNGTVVLIVMIFPLLFYIYKEDSKSRLWMFSCLACIAIALGLIFSRSGMIGFLAVIFLYSMRFTLSGLLKTMTAVLLVVVIASSGIVDKSLQRLQRVSVTANMLMQGEDLNTNMNDYNRVMLLKGALATAKDNFWFGTGLGLENYRRGFHKASDYAQDSKSHNFYISYFAELGIAGFSLLLFILILIFKKLSPLSSRHKAFRVSFLVMALMMTMNEYILLPEIWFFYGMLAGISHLYGIDNHREALRPLLMPFQQGYPRQTSFNQITNRSLNG